MPFSNIRTTPRPRRVVTVKRLAAVMAGGTSIALALLHGMSSLGGFPWAELPRLVH